MVGHAGVVARVEGASSCQRSGESSSAGCVGIVEVAGVVVGSEGALGVDRLTAGAVGGLMGERFTGTTGTAGSCLRRTTTAARTADVTGNATALEMADRAGCSARFGAARRGATSVLCGRVDGVQSTGQAGQTSSGRVLEPHVPVGRLVDGMWVSRPTGRWPSSTPVSTWCATRAGRRLLRFRHSMRAGTG